MALDLRRSLLGVLGGIVLFAVPACVVDEKRSGDDDDDDDPECEMDSHCDAGEICVDEICVDQPVNGSGGSSGGAGKGSGGSGTSGTTGSSGSSSSGTGGGSSGGSSGSGSGGDGAAGSSNSGGSGPGGGAGGSGGSSASGGSGGSTTPGECSETDPITCPTADSMILCIDGANETFTCQEACEEILGFEAGACEAGEGCVCGAPLDEACANGTIALCSCIDPQCTEDEALDVYIECFSNAIPENTEALHCLADYVDLETEMVDCEGGQTCLPEAPDPEPAPAP
jgi:hypothetical protein